MTSTTYSKLSRADRKRMTAEINAEIGVARVRALLPRRLALTIERGRIVKRENPPRTLTQCSDVELRELHYVAKYGRHLGFKLGDEA